MSDTPSFAAEPTTSPSEGRFDVFISYRRSDVAFARLLDKALNAYVPPKTLDVPQRRLRAFRDEGDLTGPEYFTAIDGFLARSDKLIVICSPAARASAFVNDEIRRFVKHRGPQHIVPVLLAGVPNNEARLAPADAAFPDALIEALELPLAVEYRGFDPQREKLRRGRFEGSWYTLLANLYGRSRDEIEQRERLRQRRQRNLWIAAGTTVGVTLASLALVAWWQKLQADEQRNVALRGLARYLVNVGRDLQAQPQDALLMALEAVRTTRDVDGSVTPEAQDALRWALARITGEPLGGGGRARVTRFSEPGRHVATMQADGTVEVFATQTGQRLLRVPGVPGRALHGVSPDGRWVVLGDGTARGLLLQPVDDPQPAAVPLGARGGLGERLLGFSDDGRWLATSDDTAAIRIWSLADPAAAPRVLQGHGRRNGSSGRAMGAVQAVFAPASGWLFTTAWDYAGLMWNLTDPAPRPQRLPDANAHAPGTFSPDGLWFVQRTDERGGRRPRLALRRLEAGAWNEVSWPPGEATAPSAEVSTASVIGFVDAPLRLLVQQAAEVEAWDLSSGVPLVQRVPGRLGAVSRDGRWLAVASPAESGSRATVRVHDLRRPGAPLRERFPSEGIGLDALPKALILDGSGRFLAVQEDKARPRLFDLEAREPQVRLLPGQDSPADKLVFSADGRWLLGTAVCCDFSVRRWRTENPGADPVILDSDVSTELKYESTSGGGGGEPAGGLPDALSISPDGRRLALPGFRGEVRVVSLDDPAAAPQVFKGPQRQVTATAFSPDGRQLVGADWAHGVHVWTIAEPQRPPSVLAELGSGTRSSVSAMKLSPDGQWVATGGATGSIVLRKLAAPAEAPRVLLGHEGWVTALDFSPDGRSLLGAGEDGKVLRWALDASAEARPVTFEGHRNTVQKARFLGADGRIVSSGADATVRVWPADPAKKPLVLRGHEGDVLALALDAGQRWLATGGDDGQFLLWDMQQRDPVPQRVGQRAAPISALALSADGRWLAAGDRTGIVRLWNRADLTSEPARLVTDSANGSASGTKRSFDSIWGLRFSPDSRWVIAMAGSRLHLWRLRLDEQIALACAAVGRNVSHDLWQAHLDRVPYRLTCPERGLHPRWIEQADDLAKKTRVDEATRMYADALRVDPSLRVDPAARSRGLAMDSVRSSARYAVISGDIDAALAFYAAANRLDPAKAVDATAEVERLKKAQKLLRDAKDNGQLGRLPRAIELFRQAREADPAIDVDPETEARRLWAPALVRQGDELAGEGRLEEAVAKYEEAIAHGGELRWDGSAEQARSIWGRAVAEKATRLSREGLLDESRQLFEEALRLYPGQGFDAAAQARKGVAEYRIESAVGALRRRSVLDAVRLIDEARVLDPEVKLTDIYLNGICWDGAVAGHAREVIGMCELAVAQSADDLRVRDSRGIARALLGQRDGAIADLTAYAEQALRDDANSPDGQARRRVVAQLRAGKRFKSFTELEALGVRR